MKIILGIGSLGGGGVMRHLPLGYVVMEIKYLTVASRRRLWETRVRSSELL